MGKQFAVILLPEDERILSDLLTSRADAAVWIFDGVGTTVASQVPGLQADPVNVAPFVAKYICRSSVDADSPRLHTFQSFTPARRPIIEYSRHDVWGGYLRHGRFYAYSEGDARLNGANYDFGEFERWRAKVFRLVKNVLIKCEQGSFTFYFGQHARAAYQEMIDKSLLR